MHVIICAIIFVPSFEKRVLPSATIRKIRFSCSAAGSVSTTQKQKILNCAKTSFVVESSYHKVFSFHVSSAGKYCTKNIFCDD